MTTIKGDQLLIACQTLVNRGISYKEMDCQAAFEAALQLCGVPKKECDLAGSNAHYRNMMWTGTPERLCTLLGVKEVPVGAVMFIVKSDGNEPAQYRADGMGNADHIGVYCGNGKTFNSSEKGGGVQYSTKFNGKKSVANGGWNMAGVSEWIDLGLTDDQMNALRGDANFNAKYADVDPTTNDEREPSAEVSAAGFTTKYSRFSWRKGDVGNGVRAVQTALNLAGADPQLKVDGDFGLKTEAAVRGFQEANGIDPIGVVGEKTWAALLDAANGIA